MERKILFKSNPISIMNIFFVIGIIFCVLMIKLILNSNLSLNNSEEFYVVLVCISFFWNIDFRAISVLFDEKKEQGDKAPSH